MNYASPAFQDTLSNALYLDLVNSKNVVVSSKLLLIDSIGVATGSVSLSNLAAGDYQLRSTTRWMLNYDKSFIFTKTIHILEDDEVIANRQIDTLNSSRAFVVKSNRSGYAPGDKAVLTILTNDDEGFAFAGDVSVSVSPMRYSSLGNEDPDIHNKLGFSDKSISTQRSQSQSIQYGIDIVGKADMKSRRKKFRRPIVMLAQEGADDLISTKAEQDGSFAFHGLLLYDTMKLSIQALSLKGDRRGVVKIDSTTKISIPPMSFSRLSAEVVKAETPRRPVAPELSGPFQMLNEVTIESQKPTKVVGSAIHLSADIVVSGEDLRNNDNGDLIMMLQSKVPGLKVLTFMEGGIVRKYFKLGGFSGYDSNPYHQEPIVLIDGSVLSNEWGETAAEQVGRLTANMIDRIEVIKFGNAAAYGARGANGAIAIYTRTDYEKSKFIDKFDRSLFTPIKIKGYSLPDKFKGYQSYPVGSTIYWNPGITLKRNEERTVEFSIPDVRGKYIVHVEGLSADHKPLKATCVFVVSD
ncbi:MAG: Plug domain-containing protein [Chryseolinea sp.]